MPKVTQQYRDARREEITAAALRCFASKGFRGTSMSDIIAESGLSAGAIYGHFESKHDIIMAVASHVIGNRMDDLRELAATHPVPAPGVVVARVMRGIAGDVAHPALLLQVWGQATIEAGVKELLLSVFAELRQAYLAYFTAWATEQEGLDAAGARAWAARLIPVAIGLAQGYIVQSALFDEFDQDAYMASIRELLPG
ncbi:TetR/AcrR family transcriptional regulator [Subtercola boreus]|uniref:HTH tetR-type domain-containing protein n=1 Tax=Subtercola boreus TaxID=120213 RepID=A0A3E0W6R2_9MICO|nr:TetR/AcrR family transcriptional regulator [Subtercola boreus]RFA18136.1 hypothetical protein B7R24_15950 [Subtercola boreus]RFA18518.1 hypothetical protein B7R23_15985 [Subtercola boreus]RFA25046.1 hypothetical protein B7R25_15980 [Subtercola boreus]